MVANEHPSGYPGHHHSGRHVVRHDGAGADNGPLADRHATQDHSTGSDRGPAAYAGWHDLPIGLGLQFP
jgi:hypothetical protein